MSDATHNLTAGGQLVAGETVDVYLASHVGGAVIDSQTLSSLSAATIEGLEWNTEYVAVGATSARRVRFRTAPDPAVPSVRLSDSNVAGGDTYGTPQILVAPRASTSPEGVARIVLVPNDAPDSLQDRTAIICFHPEREHVEDATIKCHRHVDVNGDPTDKHLQIHTKNAAGDDLTSRLEIEYGTDDAYILVTSAHLFFDNGAYIKTDTDGLPIKDSGGVQRFEFEDSGVLGINSAGQFSATATAGGVHTVPATARKYWVVRDETGTLRKIALYDA